MQAAQLQGACQGYGGCHFPVFSSPALPPLHSTPIVISHQLSNLQPSILLEYMQPPEPWKEREIYLLSLLVQSSDFHFHVQLLYRSVWAQKRTLTWSEHKRMFQHKGPWLLHLLDRFTRQHLIWIMIIQIPTPYPVQHLRIRNTISKCSLCNTESRWLE